MSFAEAGRLGAEKSTVTHKRLKQERIKKYNENPTTCENCNKALPYDKRENKFCGHSCAATRNNLGKRKHGRYAKTPCQQCGTITKNVFCTQECHKQYEWKRAKEKIEQTRNANPYDGKVAPKVPKRYLLETRGQKCEICGRKNWNGKLIPIVLDHVDGDSTNWMLKNLRLLCCNCDAQTNTYKGRNKGNGRRWRRERYKEGKSY